MGAWVSGIDVSHWQLPLTAPVGTQYAWIKSSQGARSRDGHLLAHHMSFGRQGIARGAYHYYDFTASPENNAANFLAATKGYQWELPHALDAEDETTASKGVVASQLLTFLRLVQRDTGRVPVVYTGKFWWDANVKHDPAFAQYPLWLARYPNAYRSGNLPAAGSVTETPAPWTRHHVWQYSDTNGTLDRNISTPDAMASLLDVASTLEDWFDMATEADRDEIREIVATEVNRAIGAIWIAEEAAEKRHKAIRVLFGSIRGWSAAAAEKLYGDDLGQARDRAVELDDSPKK